MRHSGVSGYIEVFLLVGVAILGSSIVFASTQKYVGEAQGPQVTASAMTLREGTSYAVLRFVLSNTGSAQIQSFFVSLSGTSPGTVSCYDVSDPATLAQIGGSCPTLTNLSSPTTIPVQVKAGTSVVAEMILSGTGLVPGQRVVVVIGAPNGGLSSQSVLVVPA